MAASSRPAQTPRVRRSAPAFKRTPAMRSPSALRRLALAAAVVAVSGCIISQGVAVRQLHHSASDSATVQTPVKAHLGDGSIIVFKRGVTVARNTVIGEGVRYSPMLDEVGKQASVSLDSVIGME